ncbi:MAG TPA: hypothetical protein VLZ84_03900 [Asticcacaulis sp.]|nr:hypothetical protein [Asticcacaulis sp.]
MKKQNGCLTAFLIVLGIIVVVGVVHLGVAYYFLSKKFEIRPVESSAAASAVSGGLFGYYVPVKDIGTDRYQLKYISLVHGEAGEQPKPIEVVLYDRKASQDIRVATLRLAINNAAITYAGHDAAVGNVTFKGGMEVAGAKHTMTGDLSMDGQTFKAITLASSEKKPE